MADAQKVNETTNVKNTTTNSNNTRVIHCKIVEIIDNKFFIVFKGLRFAFENIKNKYQLGDIVTVEYNKSKMTIKDN